MYTWNFEKKTEHVVIAFLHSNNKGNIVPIIKIVIDYLRSDGINGPDYNGKYPSLNSFYVDLANKTYILMNGWEAAAFTRASDTCFFAYPSQISQFIATHQGRLTGRKFGL